MPVCFHPIRVNNKKRAKSPALPTVCTDHLSHNGPFNTGSRCIPKDASPEVISKHAAAVERELTSRRLHRAGDIMPAYLAGVEASLDHVSAVTMQFHPKKVARKGTSYMRDVALILDPYHVRFDEIMFDPKKHGIRGCVTTIPLAVRNHENVRTTEAADALMHRKGRFRVPLKFLLNLFEIGKMEQDLNVFNSQM
ncbi:hypothetical protein HDU88_002518 [Geranomyces variabilis]|nr:hypothetical protein HDU88_002518 [Geranomyces variabilis]